MTTRIAFSRYKTTDMKELIKNLKDYFECEVIGSYMFVEAGYLKVDHINDIDIMVPDLPTLKKVIVFLKDKGFEERMISGNWRTTGENRYGQFETGSLIFDSDNYILPVHLLLAKSDSRPIRVWTLSELIGAKWALRTESDLDQLKVILENTSIT